MSNGLNVFRQAIKALRTNPVRTGLTTLGIVIGISTVILVLSAGAGFRSLIQAQVATLGTNTLFIQTRIPPTTKNRNAGAVQADTGRAMSAVAITTFKNRDLEDIKKLPNVVNVYGMVTGQAVVSYRNTEKNIIYYGAGSARFNIDQGVLKEGRFYTSAEDLGAAQVVILGSRLATDLFGNQDPLGKLVRVGNENFQVIGVYAPRGGLGGGDTDGTLFMPLGTAQKKMLGIDYLLVGIVQLKNLQLADPTMQDIQFELRKNHHITDPAKDDFLVQTQAQAMDIFNTIFNAVTILLMAIAAISLVVGGVGIMNIMYVVVTERTAEIGLKKALGATNADILGEFLIESVLVTILGGVIGILFGALLGWLVALAAEAGHLSWTFSVPLYAILLGVGVSALIGISFGVLPAKNAARLNPIEALRHE
ncbi:MAG TPA: ABC transporter permease [Patescibacteria group bacterium]|nr:ABC transporter permease [Patescibacteria group bacterium]